MSKKTVAVIMLLGLQAISSGCRNEEPEAKSNGAPQGDSASGAETQTIVGRYHNQADFDEYIDLKPDGMAFWHERVGLSGYDDGAGQWKVYGNELMLIGPLGDVERAQIVDRTIQAYDKVWIGEARGDELKNGVPGRYDWQVEIPGKVVEVTGNVYFVLGKDGSVSCHSDDGQQSGVWKIEKGLIQIYGQDGQKKLTDGRLYANDMYFPLLNEEGGVQKLARQIPGRPSPRGMPRTNAPARVKPEIVRLRMAFIERALQQFQHDCGRLPNASEGGLEALLVAPPDLQQRWNGPYLKRSQLLDPWDRPYVYFPEGKYNPGSFDLVSLGADGQEGGDGENADIVND